MDFTIHRQAKNIKKPIAPTLFAHRHPYGCRSIERQIQLIVESGTDVNNMLLKKLNLGSADYFNSFIDLAKSGVLESDFALKIAPSTGLRNILFHEYTKIDDTIVHQSIADIKHYYGMYLKIMAEYLECDLNHWS